MKQHSTGYFVIILLLASALPLLSFYTIPATKLRVRQVKAGSGNSYTILYKDALKIGFTLKRPDKKDEKIMACIPGAFTDLGSMNVDGLHIVNGKAGNSNKVNHSLGGGITMINGEPEIFPTGKGKLLND